MKKLTAVEWLIQEYINGAFINIQIMKEALEMEKKQIIEFTTNYFMESHTKSVNQYYNETFKSE
jgi:hypothetical protein